jgi:hypothetical protein
MSRLRYTPEVKKLGPSNKQGRYQNPELWITGPCPIRRDKYYGWLKHRAQAKYRGEYYNLSWEAFEQLWFDDDMWFQRGRKVTDLCMSLIDFEQGWTDGNVEVITRLEQLRKPKHNVES